MGYGKEIYLEAQKILEGRRNRAEQIAEQKKAALYRLCPKAEEIQRQKSATSVRIAKAVLRGTDVREALTKLRDENRQLQRDYNALVQAHGFAKEDVLPVYSCSLCSDTGFVDGKMCSCLKQLQKQLAYEELNRSLPITGSSFENFQLSYYQGEARKSMEQIYRYCQAYACRFHRQSPSFIFRGDTGLGKTHLSLAVAAEVTQRGFGVIYSSAQNLAVALERERFDRSEDSGLYSTDRKIKDCDLLIIDDLGVEFNSGYVTAALYNVIDTRLLAGSPTIISTNLKSKEMEQRYGPRFVSRMYGQFGIFECVGSDIRIQKRRGGQTEGAR